jgi:hypothetical protein
MPVCAPQRLSWLNEIREHGEINDLSPSEIFLQRLITSTTIHTAVQC